MGGTRCRGCGGELPDEARFCDACGATVAPKPMHRTLVGMAAPSVATSRVVGVGESGEAQPGSLPAASVERVRAEDAREVAPAPIRKGTMMGVALPGIAPISSTAGKSGPPPPFIPPPPPPPRIAIAPSAVVTQTAGAHDRLEEERMTLAPPVRQGKSRGPLVIAVVLVVVALAGLALVLVQLLKADKPPALDARVALSAKGTSVIVQCGACAAGSELAIGDRRATFDDAHEASFGYDEGELALGTTSLRGALTMAGKKKAIGVTFDVLNPYAVHIDLGALATGGGAQLVFALAPEVTSLTVDGGSVEVDDGAATKDVPLAIGHASDATAMFHRDVSFEMGLASGGRVEGAVGFDVPYAPLVVSLPGAHAFAIGGTIAVAGRSKPGAIVHANGDSIAVGADGAFSGTVKIGADGKLQWLAYGPGLAPTGASTAVTEVGSKDDLVRSLRARTKSSIATISSAPDAHLDEVVEVKLVVRRAELVLGRAVAAGDAKCSTETCPALRVLLPTGVTPSSGETIDVIGFVTRGVPFEGKTAVEIDAVVAP